MAYHETEPLDLSGLHVVCLTGENGAGKSTLLDAMTWALWGQARAKRDDELISQGESDMRVSLVFKEGGNTYQVVRTRKLGRATARTKTPTSSGSLDFLVEDKGTWRTLNESRQSETQAKIIRILNLTYETFINSAFLKQGRADEFTLKTPAERKALLAEILSLDVWAGYEDHVKQEQTALEQQQNLLRFELQQAEAEIARLPVYERELGTAQAASVEASDALQQAEAAMAEIDRQRERVKALRAQRVQAEDRLKGILSEIDNIHSERAKHQGLLADYQAALDQREAFESGYAEYERARALNDELNSKLASMVELNARKSAAENAIADERRGFESERDTAHRKVYELEQMSDDRTLRAQLALATEQLVALVAQQESRDNLARELIESRERQAELKAQNDELRRKMKELKSRIDALSTVGAICPTCGRELAEGDRQRVLAEWKDQGRQWGDTYRAGEEMYKQLSALRTSLEAQIADAERVLVRLPGQQREVTALEERLSRAGEAAMQLPAARAGLERVERVLAEQAFALEARAALAAVTQELADLGYDSAAHKKLRDIRLPQLQVYVERKTRLDRADIGIESERHALESLVLRENALCERQRKEEASIAALKSEIGECEKALQRATQIETMLQRARMDYFAAQRKVGEANQRVQSCRVLESTRDRLKKDLDGLAKRLALLTELRIAFGKNGVPAMIIEAILPELEDSANELLSRMTNGRMNVRFETQRQTLKGDVSETLELRISDELGERPYEMFSGGEAFRVNFAIRVALSKLLANRAGARLQTLFTDEGFGTQDAQGRERLVEAIRSIQDEFEMIVVITHIDELKDAFPARIDVTKTFSGSLARVM
ncbi:MAG: SMC family ATPase [Chloroflexi bacterium]|nr:SMC family ATPase [Chloroflexota bacterium]